MAKLYIMVYEENLYTIIYSLATPLCQRKADNNIKGIDGTLTLTEWELGETVVPAKVLYLYQTPSHWVNPICCPMLYYLS